MIASHILKWVHYKQDTEAEEIELRYFRDIDSREVDFVLTNQGKPFLLVECKTSETEVSSSLKYLSEKYPEARAVQVVAETDKHFKTGRIEVIPAVKFLGELV